MTAAYPVLAPEPTGPAGSVPARPWRCGPFTTPKVRTFPGVPACVPQARRFVSEMLADCPARDTLMICVSEFATNAIAHTASGNGGVFTVEVDCPREGVARVAVTDAGGPGAPRAGRLVPPPGGIMAEGGRGLAMVAACTSRWGYADAPSGLGCTVWAEACWPVGLPSAGAAGPAGQLRTGSRRSRFPESAADRREPTDPDDPIGPGGDAA